MAPKEPAKIGKYDVIDVIGRGGMGVVYEATDPFLNRRVAIKMMTGGFSDNPDLLKRFFREAQSTGSLQHPNIVTVFELGDHGGNPYLVMEFLEGESLDAIISSRRQLSSLEKIQLIIGVCHGLSHAHHRGIVHRDIKPGNIMVSKEGSVKIVDFGIAHIGAKSQTRTGQIMGSVNYMAPEQVNGSPVDARTDIFSTGVVLYELFTYSHPFDGENMAAEEGVLHIKCPALMNGYHKLPEATLKVMTPDGYYITGDVFSRDAQGFYFFLGRADDMFVCGGENIYPSEVEKMLERHPAIQQACVVPVADEIKGQKPAAFVVLKPDTAVSEREIKDYALANAPAYQHPRRVWFLKELPLAGTNKIDTKALMKLAEERTLAMDTR